MVRPPDSSRISQYEYRVLVHSFCKYILPCDVAKAAITKTPTMPTAAPVAITRFSTDSRFQRLKIKAPNNTAAINATISNTTNITCLLSPLTALAACDSSEPHCVITLYRRNSSGFSSDSFTAAPASRVSALW